MTYTGQPGFRIVKGNKSLHIVHHGHPVLCFTDAVELAQCTAMTPFDIVIIGYFLSSDYHAYWLDLLVRAKNGPLSHPCTSVVASL